jgi:hypothetical protein
MVSDKLNFFLTQQQQQTVFNITVSYYTEHVKEVITQDIFFSVITVVSSEI